MSVGYHSVMRRIATIAGFMCLILPVSTKDQFVPIGEARRQLTRPRPHPISEALDRHEKGELVDHLDLADSSVKDEDLQFVAKLRYLRTLQLYNTTITDKGIGALVNLEFLERLYISRTLVTDDCTADLAKLRSLKELYIGDTKITDKAMGQLANLSGMENLGLAGTAITDDSLETMSHFKQLQNLDLSCTAIRGNQLGSLSGLERFESLELSCCTLSEGAFDSLATLASLKRIGLSGAKFDVRGLTRLGKLNLRGLDLRYSPVTDADIPRLAKLTNLRVILLSRPGITGITEKGITQLQPLLKRCRLELMD